MKSEEKSVICETCRLWVKCKASDKAKVAESHGFCVVRDLFTYTAETKCKDHQKGEPMSEKDWEECQRDF